MYLTPLQAFGIIAAISVGTQITRWLPFWLFPESKKPPPSWSIWAMCCPPP